MENEQFNRQRKFLLALPLLVLPFLAMAFWSLGGGKGTGGKDLKDTIRGINTTLPVAQLKPDKMPDKLSFYDQMKQDSGRNAMEGRQQKQADTILRPLAPDSNELRIRRKLAQINRAIAQPDRALVPVAEKSLQSPPSQSADVDRLQAMMNSMNENKANDRDMQQMSSVLDKILDVQHPERAAEKIREESLKNKAAAYPVETDPDPQVVDVILPVAADTVRRPLSITRFIASGFHDLNDPSDSGREDNAIPALIDQTQVLVAGAVVRMRLAADIYVNGNLIAKGEEINGICGLAGERLTIEVASLRFRNSILPVALTAYDMDGLPGLYIPGAITRDAVKQGTDNAIQSIGLMNMDPSVTAQATSAGIETVKSLVSKKVKLVKVTVKAGYQVLLKDNNQKKN